MQLTPQQIAQIAYDEGFRGTGLVTIIAITLQESGGDTNAQHVNNDGSIDRGVLQWNTRYWPQISDTCAYDPVCAYRTAYQVTNGGQNFSPWSLDFTTGRLAAHWATAQAAAASVTGTMPIALPSTGGGGGSSLPIPAIPDNLRGYLILAGLLAAGALLVS